MAPITTYCSQADLDASINPAALASSTSPQKDAAIENASRMIDEALPSQYKLPLSRVGGHVKSKCADIAVYRLLVGRGYNPEAGSDPGIRDRYNDAIKWLALVREGKVTPDITDSGLGDSLTAGRISRPTVISSSSRGFSARGDPNGRGPFQGD